MKKLENKWHCINDCTITKLRKPQNIKTKKNPETILFKKKCEKKKRKKQMKTLVKNHQNKPKETTLKKYKKDVNEASIIV